MRVVNDPPAAVEARMLKEVPAGKALVLRVTVSGFSGVGLLSSTVRLEVGCITALCQRVAALPSMALPAGELP
ncbi:hypothetical protein D3C72_1866680 [compost metagenome]